MRDEFVHFNRLDLYAFPPSARLGSLLLALIVMVTIVFETASVVSA
jgi:hypothetical protein